MSVFKVTCPDCGQRVSGDESFLGKRVSCPVCAASIEFPEEIEEAAAEKPGTASGAAPEKDAPPAENAATRRVAAAAAAAAKASTSSKQPAPALKSLTRVSPKKDSKPDAPEAEARVSTASLWSIVCGAGAFAACPIGPLFAAPAIVCGHIGRGNIQKSHGKLTGMGLATGGLMLGYLFFILLFAAGILLPWKQLWGIGVQRFNENSAAAIVEALSGYARAHDGEYPDTLEDLSPEFLTPRKAQSLGWRPPSRIREITPFIYYPPPPEADSTKDAPPLVLVSPHDETDGVRTAAYLDGKTESIPSEKLEALLPGGGQ